MNEPITYGQLEDLDYELNMTEGLYRNNKDADEWKEWCLSDEH